MKVISTTVMRKRISSIIDRAARGEVFGIGRRDRVDALLMPFPKAHNDTMDEITNVNAYSASFDFLKDEPDIYSIDDLKKRYV